MVRKLRPQQGAKMVVKSDDEIETDGARETSKKKGLQQQKRKRKAKKSKGGTKKAKEKTVKEKEKEKSQEKLEGKPSYNETTLVVCPLSVLQNWTGQVDQHCDTNKVKYFVYHGDSAKFVRKRDTFNTFLSRFNFVFTTYDTIRMEYKVIQKRRQAELDKAEREELKKEKELAKGLEEEVAKEENGVSATPSDDEDDSKKPKMSLKRDAFSREGSSSSSVFKPDSDNDGDSDGSQGKQRIKKSKEKGKGKGRDWIDSDDSFVASDDAHDFLSSGKRDNPREIPLFEVTWRRIVLDEAHICRNTKTQLYNAICELKSERRWAVTGTPIVNSTKDLGALAAWCGLQPFAAIPKEWSKLIERPLKRSGSTEQAAALLRKVVTSICLRRHKSMKNSLGDPIVKLPEIKFYKHTIPLTTADRDYYSKCEMACREHLSRWAEQGDLNQHRSAILLFLLRLRQMSCHRRLIGNTLLEEIQNKDWDSVDKSRAGQSTQLTKEDIKSLQDKLKTHVQLNDDCPVCMEALLGRDPVITPCGHPFCKACLSSIVSRGNFSESAKCPMDRKPLPGMDKMVELSVESAEGFEDEQEEYEELNATTSAKVSEALKIVRATLRRDPTEKM